ncbi:unnamed protein product, partial [marine sediment metagenome]
GSGGFEKLPVPRAAADGITGGIDLRAVAAIGAAVVLVRVDTDTLFAPAFRLVRANEPRVHAQRFRGLVAGDPGAGITLAGTGLAAVFTDFIHWFVAALAAGASSRSQPGPACAAAQASVVGRLIADHPFARVWVRNRPCASP